LRQTGQPLQNITSESEAPDIDGVEATDEGFEDAPQEGTRERTSGSLMESDLLGMTGAREPIGQNTYTRRLLISCFFVIIFIYF